MVDLKESDIKHLLPAVLKNSDQVKALGFALDNQIKLLIDTAYNSLIYANIAKLPEKMIDLLAVELRTMYYDERLPLETKRTLVINTIKIYQKLGTPAAVKEMVTYVCGNAEIEEWYNYEGNPYLFRVYVTCNREKITYAHKNIVRLINSVKNARSWLEYIHYTERLETIALHVSSILQTYDECTLNESIERKVAKKILTKSLLELYSEQILNSNIDREIKGNIRIATNDNFGMYEEVIVNSNIK